jgi:hypothetical protein
LYLIAASDKGIYNERDVEFCLKTPVLTMIPSIDPDPLRRAMRGRPEKSHDLAGVRA